jgi:hypothetical protein
MVSHRDANRGHDPQRPGSLPEELASTSQQRTASMSANRASTIERRRAGRACDDPPRMAALPCLEAPAWS